MSVEQLVRLLEEAPGRLEVSSLAGGPAEQPHGVPNAAEVASAAENLNRLGGPDASLPVASGSELVMQVGQAIRVPALGATIAEATGGIDGPVEELEALAPVVAEPEEVAKAVGELDQQLVEGATGNLWIVVDGFPGHGFA